MLYQTKEQAEYGKAEFFAIHALEGQNPPLVMAKWDDGGCEMCECVDNERADFIAKALRNMQCGGGNS